MVLLKTNSKNLISIVQQRRLTNEHQSKDRDQKNKTPITASTLMRLAGLSAIVAGLSIIFIGMFHPLNISSAVTTATWVNVHILATALGFFGLLGLAGIYARQVEESGWLGLIGFLLLSAWMTLVCGFSFVEAFIEPRLVTEFARFYSQPHGDVHQHAQRD